MSGNERSIRNSCCQDAPAAVRREGDAWSYLPQIDVIERGDHFEIVCDAPGVQADGVDLTYENGMLSLHGKVLPRQAEGTNYLRHEYGVGDFDRKLPLGRLAEFVDAAGISAAYRDGVLSIRLPKLQAAQPRRITVCSS